jgi:hypothetical protein
MDRKGSSGFALSRWLAGGTSVGLVLLLAMRAAAADPTPDLDHEVRDLRGKVTKLEKSRDDALSQIAELRALVSDLKRQIPAAHADGAGAKASVPAIARGSNIRSELQLARDENGTAAAGPESEEVGTTKKEERQYSAERVILEQQRGVLLPAGQLVVQPGFQYTNIGRNLVDVSGFFPIPGLIFGRIETASINRNFYTTSLDLRYGLHRRAEFEVTVPYSFRSDRSETDLGGTNEQVESIRDSGIGDISFGVNTQVLYQRKWWPDTVLNLLVKAPTGASPFDVNSNELAFGTGTWGVNGGFTMVRALDPAVIYGSIKYLWDIEDKTNGLTFDLGDGFEYTAGLAFSLNERLAFTTSLQHSIIGRSKVNGQSIAGSDLNAARLFLGASYRMTQAITANLNLGIGLTDDAPDYSLELSFPLRLPWELPHF